MNLIAEWIPSMCTFALSVEGCRDVITYIDNETEAAKYAEENGYDDIFFTSPERWGRRLTEWS